MDDQTNSSPVEPSQPEVAAIKKNNSSLESVQADAVQLNDSSVNQVNATNVTIHESGVRQVNAQSVTMNGGGAGIANAGSLQISNGGIGICSASDASIDGNVGVMIGQSVTLNNHRTGLVVTSEVHGGHIQSVIFLAGKSNAPVETVVDQRSIGLFGLATGIAFGLVFSLLRILKR